MNNLIYYQTMKKITLKEAIKKGKLKEFIKEREQDKPADAEKFDATLSSMVGKSKATPKASSQDDPER